MASPVSLTARELAEALAPGNIPLGMRLVASLVKFDVVLDFKRSTVMSLHDEIRNTILSNLEIKGDNEVRQLNNALFVCFLLSTGVF